MQLCQFHLYQKIGRKKVARINAALEFMYIIVEKRSLKMQCYLTVNVLWFIVLLFPKTIHEIFVIVLLFTIFIVHLFRKFIEDCGSKQFYFALSNTLPYCCL